MNELKITEVNVYPLKNPKPGTKLKANCKVTFNESISVNGKLWNGRNGLFVGADGRYGDKKLEDGTTEQVFYSSWNVKDQEVQEQMKEEVIKVYNKITGNSLESNDNQDRNQEHHQNQMGDHIPF